MRAKLRISKRDLPRLQCWKAGQACEEGPVVALFSTGDSSEPVSLDCAETLLVLLQSPIDAAEQARQHLPVLTRGPNGRAVVSTEQLVTDDAKESAWMAAHDTELDLLVDTLYRRFQFVVRGLRRVRHFRRTRLTCYFLEFCRNFYLNTVATCF